ncbi:MAG TPA: tRNA pseudouridine(55) synthase TruB [Bryobacteraceae bacterium]|nr:tRNA pseudouridine(55) synthase TruB [Bryobacteraceae bacterium]
MIVVNKPEGWTSHDAVGKMRRLAGTKRVGHLGTLDPMATGVLPLVLGKATRLAQFYVRCDKNYEALIRFGHSTDSHDRVGEQTSAHVEVELDRGQVEQALAELGGVQLQIPPVISAKKIGGVPAYKLARKNVALEMKPVAVTIYSLHLQQCAGNEIRISMHCSGGTYVRSLARDLGDKLGCGAYLQELVRTASGDFTMEQARTIPELTEMAAERRLDEALIQASRLLPHFPAEVVDGITEAQIRQGRDFRVSPFRVLRGTKYVRAFSSDGGLVAVGEVKLPNLYHPILVL